MAETEMSLIAFLHDLSRLDHLAETSSSNVDRVRNDFIQVLFDAGGEDLENAFGDDVISPALSSLFRDYSWDIVDTAFIRCNGSSVNDEHSVDVDHLMLLFRMLKPYVRAKEWEIIVLEKVYSCHTAVEFQLLLYAFQLLIVDGAQSFVDLCRDFRAIQRILDKFSDAGQQILTPCVQHAIAFLNGLLSRSTVWNPDLRASLQDILDDSSSSLKISRLYVGFLSSLAYLTASYVPVESMASALLSQLAELFLRVASHNDMPQFLHQLLDRVSSEVYGRARRRYVLTKNSDHHSNGGDKQSLWQLLDASSEDQHIVSDALSTQSCTTTWHRLSWLSTLRYVQIHGDDTFSEDAPKRSLNDDGDEEYARAYREENRPLEVKYPALVLLLVHLLLSPHYFGHDNDIPQAPSSSYLVPQIWSRQTLEGWLATALHILAAALRILAMQSDSSARLQESWLFDAERDSISAATEHTALYAQTLSRWLLRGVVVLHPPNSHGRLSLPQNTPSCHNDNREAAPHTSLYHFIERWTSLHQANVTALFDHQTTERPSYIVTANHASAHTTRMIHLAAWSQDLSTLGYSLLAWLATCTDVSLRRSVYFALRSCLCAFEPRSRLHYLRHLLTLCAAPHIQVLLLDTVKDFVQSVCLLPSSSAPSASILAGKRQHSVPCRRFSGREEAALGVFRWYRHHVQMVMPVIKFGSGTQFEVDTDNSVLQTINAHLQHQLLCTTETGDAESAPDAGAGAGIDRKVVTVRALSQRYPSKKSVSESCSYSPPPLQSDATLHSVDVVSDMVSQPETNADKEKWVFGLENSAQLLDVFVLQALDVVWLALSADEVEEHADALLSRCHLISFLASRQRQLRGSSVGRLETVNDAEIAAELMVFCDTYALLVHFCHRHFPAICTAATSASSPSERAGADSALSLRGQLLQNALEGAMSRLVALISTAIASEGV